MIKKILLSESEYEVLKKVLKSVPPAKTTLNGAEMRDYREILTIVFGEDYRFPDTDDK